MMHKNEHFVSQFVFDATRDEQLAQAYVHAAHVSPQTLFWLKFKQHKLAYVSMWFLGLLYCAILFVEYLAPYSLETQHQDYVYAPPQTVHFFHEGTFIGPFVYGYDQTFDLNTFKKTFIADKTQYSKLRFFCRGTPYNWLGIIPLDYHLICSSNPDIPLILLGTDRLGRDLLSRILYGMRISLTIGLFGIFVSLIIGISLGGCAGYFGGKTDIVIQRIIEIFRSIPELPLWMSLAAIMPIYWSPIWVYFALTIILGLVDWPGLARAIRSKFLSLREEDYCQNAKMLGASPRHIIIKHLLPNFYSHLIASISLSIPTMILGETALSFLGLGLRPPITSWGVLLNEAQNIQSLTLYPWLLLPVIPVILVVLGFNFMGDGLRDAADPHK